MWSNKNWICAADYTCILIRIVWTPFLLSLTHTHAIRKMVCQKRLESVCGKKQALTSRWFIVVCTRGWPAPTCWSRWMSDWGHLPLYFLRLSIWAEFSLCQFWLDNWTMWSQLTFTISPDGISPGCLWEGAEHFTNHMTTQELSSSGARRRQEQSVVKQCGIMHSYIEFAHVVCLVALPEHHCVQWVQGDISYIFQSRGVGHWCVCRACPGVLQSAATHLATASWSRSQA